MMAATSSNIKMKQGQFFLPSTAEKVLLASKETVTIDFDDYGSGPGAKSPLIRWNNFKEVLNRSFPKASLMFKTFDTEKLIIPMALYRCLENLEYQAIAPQELQARLENTKRLIELIHQLRTEDLPLQERNALIERVKILLEQKADPTVADDNGWNILHLAAYFNVMTLATWVRKCATENEERILFAAMTCDSEVTPAGLAKQQGHVSLYEGLRDMNRYDESSSNSFSL